MNIKETNEKKWIYKRRYKKNDLNFGCEVNCFDEKEKNPFWLKILLDGVQNSIYEGGFYTLKVIFPKSYSISRPSAYF